MKKIKIGYRNYEIIETVVNDTLIDGGQRCYGQVYYDEEKIYLNAENCDPTTLLHEVLHAISEMYNIGLEERQVEMLSKGLYITAIDNDLTLKENNKE